MFQGCKNNYETAGLSWCSIDSAVPCFVWDAELHARVAIIAKQCNKACQLLDRTLGLHEGSLERRSAPPQTGQLARPGTRQGIRTGQVQLRVACCSPHSLALALTTRSALSCL